MQPDNEDTAFWQNLISEVTPTQSQAHHVFRNASPLSVKISEHPVFAAVQDFSAYSKALEDYADTHFGGIDKNTMRKFKREEFAVEATLDLHGKTENAAYDAVADFVVRAYTAGKRCIIIITGKGLNVHDDDIFATKGVLKKLVPQWLNQPQLRAMILVYKHPSARLGGAGALYILLRRNNKK